MGEAKRKAENIKNKYQYVTDKGGNEQAIGITDHSKYDGVVYRYGKVTFGEENGPRMGFFISFFGVKETIDLMEKKLKM